MKNKSIIKTALCCLGFFAIVNLSGQQDPNRSFYRYTMNLVNPAYAGAAMGTEGTAVGPGSELGMNLRSQWVSVEGAPESQSVFFGTTVSKNIGLGVSIINDRTFIESSTSINVDVSYELKLSEVTVLYLGIKAGGNSYDANLLGLSTFGIGADPNLTDIDGGFNPNVGAGALIKGKRFFASLSVPRILSNDRLTQENGLATFAAGRAHVYLAGGYDFDLSEGFKFKPSTIFRYVDAAPISIDFTAAFNFNDKIELGPSYRIGEGFGGLFIFNAANWIDMGYAYEAAFNNEITIKSQGTHEVFIKLKM